MRRIESEENRRRATVPCEQCAGCFSRYAISRCPVKRYGWVAVSPLTDIVTKSIDKIIMEEQMKALTAQDWGRLIGQKAMYKGAIFEIKHLLDHECGTLFIGDGHGHVSAKLCKPILRRVEDMTDEEKDEFVYSEGYKSPTLNFWIEDNSDIIWFNVYHRDVEHFISQTCSINDYDWLESKGFDIRGWIDAGLAIDAKEVEK